MSTSSDDDATNRRRPVVFVSRLLSSSSSDIGGSSSDEEGRGGESPVPELQETRSGRDAQLLSVLERVASMDHSSSFLQDQPAAPHKRPDGGGDALRRAVKRIRVDEMARVEELRRMTSIAMTRTDETASVAQQQRNAATKIQQDQLRVVMASKIGRNHQGAHQSASTLSAVEGGRIVAVTGGSVVMAPGTPPKGPAKRVVARARCA